MLRKEVILVLALFIGTSVVSAGASEQQVVMAIEGMTCELCAVAVKKSLGEVKGVKTVKVSFEEKKAWLTTDASVADEMLAEAVQKAGAYTGTVIEKKQNVR